MHEIDYKIVGDDMQFVEIELDPMEATVAEAGGMMCMDDGIEMETIFKSALFGGEGLFFATLRGPGKVWLQSLPFSRMADRMVSAAAKTGRGGREEGSVLGGLGRMLDGDRS
jgi:uncharacterized protein (AIM24 family)